MLNEMGQIIGKLDKRQRIIIAVVAGVSLCLFYAFMYSDILITTSFGINFWDTLFSGNIFRFYEVCHTDVDNAAYQIYGAPDYDFLIYVIFAIWDFPLWLIRKLFHVNIWESALAIAWAKTIVLLFTLLTVKAMLDICKTLCMEEKNRKHVLLLFVTSPILYMSVFVISQYDVIYLFLMLKALDWYLKDDLWKFTIYMSIALPIKLLSIFLYPPLLLYKEKNIIRAGLKTIVLFLPWVVLKLVFPMGESNNGNMSNILLIFHQKLICRDLEIPVFLLAVVIFYIVCYVIKPAEDKKSAGLNSIRIAFMSYALFFLICRTPPYWYILILPLQCILIGLNDNIKFISTVIETITSVCYVGMSVWLVPWCFDVNLLRSTYVSKLFGLRSDTTNNVLELLHTVLPSVYDLAENRAEAYLFMVFLAGTFIFTGINYIRPDNKNITWKNVETPKYIYGIRYAMGICVCLLPVAAYIF